MEINTRESGSGMVIDFPESIQLEGDRSREFKGMMRGAIEGVDKRVVVDLGNVEFIDSSGLGALISSLKVLRGNGGDLVLCSMSSQVHTVFEITRLLRVFEVFNDVETALDNAPRALSGATGAGRE